MKIEAVEAANIPIEMTSLGEMKGRLWGLGKDLSSFRDVPEYFAGQPVLRDRAKVATVRAFGMCAYDKDFSGLRVDLLDLLDHCTVNRMFKYDLITWFKGTQDQRDCGGDQEIPLVVFGFHAVTADFDKF
jgi:hypothetical protein